jgi:hypothetical protein
MLCTEFASRGSGVQIPSAPPLQVNTHIGIRASSVRTTAAAVTALSPCFGPSFEHPRMRVPEILGSKRHVHQTSRWAPVQMFRLRGLVGRQSTPAACEEPGSPSGRWMISRCRERLASMVSAVMQDNASLCAAGGTRPRVDHAPDRRLLPAAPGILRPVRADVMRAAGPRTSDGAADRDDAGLSCRPRWALGATPSTAKRLRLAGRPSGQPATRPVHPPPECQRNPPRHLITDGGSDRCAAPTTPRRVCKSFGRRYG